MLRQTTYFNSSPKYKVETRDKIFFERGPSSKKNLLIVNLFLKKRRMRVEKKRRPTRLSRQTGKEWCACITSKVSKRETCCFRTAGLVGVVIVAIRRKTISKSITSSCQHGRSILHAYLALLPSLTERLSSTMAHLFLDHDL